MKTTLLILGILLIATPFVLLCLYALTPWEPYRGFAAYICGVISSLSGLLCLAAYGEMACDERKEKTAKDRHPWFEKNNDPTFKDRD